MSDDRPSRGSQPRPPGTFKVGTIAGSDVLVSRSWFLIAGLIAVITAPAVEEVEPGLGGLKYVGGFALAVLLYLSVLAHEASHAYAARRYGLPVSHITLQFFGGMTAIDGEPESPRQEFWVSVVGPLSSLAVALVAYLASPGGSRRPDRPRPLRARVDQPLRRHHQPGARPPAGRRTHPQGHRVGRER